MLNKRTLSVVYQVICSSYIVYRISAFRQPSNRSRAISRQPTLVYGHCNVERSRLWLFTWHLLVENSFQVIDSFRSTSNIASVLLGALTPSIVRVFVCLLVRLSAFLPHLLSSTTAFWKACSLPNAISNSLITDDVATVFGREKEGGRQPSELHKDRLGPGNYCQTFSVWTSAPIIIRR